MAEANNPSNLKVTLSDRQLLIEVLKAQREIAKILFHANININSRESAATLHTDLSKLVDKVTR